MFRTPPQTTKSNEEPTSSCQICGVIDNRPYVCCDRCTLWFHFECAQAPDDVAEKLWFCQNCIVLKSTSNNIKSNVDGPPQTNNTLVSQQAVTTTGQIQQVSTQRASPYQVFPQQVSSGSNTVVRKNENNSGRSQKAKSNGTSSSVGRKLALLRLEEERQFELQEEVRRKESNKEYLDRKYALLEDENNSNADDEDLTIDNQPLDQAKYDAIKRWTEEVLIPQRIAAEYLDIGRKSELLMRTRPTEVDAYDTETDFDENQAARPSNEYPSVDTRDLRFNRPNGHQNADRTAISSRYPQTGHELIFSAPGASTAKVTPSYANNRAYTENYTMPSNIPQQRASRNRQDVNTLLADVNRIRSQFGFRPLQRVGFQNERDPNEPLDEIQNLQERSVNSVVNQQVGNRFDQDQFTSNIETQMTTATSAHCSTHFAHRPVMSTSVYQPRQSHMYGPRTSTSAPHRVSQAYNPNHPVTSTVVHQLYNTTSSQNYFRNPHISTSAPHIVSQAHNRYQSNTHEDPDFGMGAAGAVRQDDVMTMQNIMSRQVVDKTLQIFSGNPLEWNAWYNRYQSTSTKCKLDNSENLARLVKCLKGGAEKLVKSKLGQTEAVPWIINTLQKVYGRPEIILAAIMRQISEMPPLKGDNLKSIMEFAFEAQSVRTAIDAPGMPAQYANPMILTDLVDKLPAQLKLDWARYKRRFPHVTVRTFTDWLDELADDISTVVEPALENTHTKKGDKVNNSNKAYVNVHVDGASKFKQSNSSSDAAESRKNQVTCPACGKGCPKVEKCSTFIAFSLDRKWKEVKEHKLCRLCLKKHTFPCKITQVCGKDGCSLKHHQLLHNSAPHPSSTTASSNVHQGTSENVMLKYVPVILHKGDKRVSTFAFFDDGTQVSMVEQHLADELGIKGTQEELCLLWTKNIHRKEKAQRISIDVSGEDTFTNRFKLNGIRTVQSLHLPAQTFKKQEFVRKYPYLADVPIRDHEDAVPGIIIGTDFPKLGVQLKTVEGDEFESPIAQKTRLGWTVYGPTKDNSGSNAKHHHLIRVCTHHNQLDQEIHQQVKEHFSIENFGVRASAMTEFESKDNRRASEMLQKLTKKVDGRYETGLLWKSDTINKSLPNSYPMAMKRLISLEKQGQQMVQQIGVKIQEYLEKGYIRKLSEQEVKELGENVWYLPVFGVTHPKKPDKLRMVFDGAAKVKSVSLNSMLLIGPDELASLIDILRRYREKLYAVGGDIKEMYHQVKVIKKDQRYQLFLFRDGDINRKPDVYIIDVLIFGSKSSPASAQFVKNTNAKLFIKTNPRAVETIITNHYVDDMMDGENTIEDTIQMIQDVKMIHASGGFEIRNFISNSPEVLKAIGCTEDLQNKELSLNSETKTERVLGMWWNTKLDVFTFSLKYTVISTDILNGKKLPTKRELLRTLMAIFDPLGLLSNYMIHLKTLLQDVWRIDLSWDEQISSKSMIKRWRQWLKFLPAVESVQVPRLYSLKLIADVPKSIEIHTFVDAGEDAFTAVTYLRIKTEEGIDCALMGSKARVAPLKYLSIPRKELQAGILGTRLSTSIMNAQRFKVDRRIFWSDSETVLSWLKSDNRKYSQFVAHRVGEILENTDVNEWRWIPTKENVADEATKWAKSGMNFQSSNRWFSGPEFLRADEDKWPAKKSVKPDVLEEMKAHCAHASLILPQLVDPKRFSKWNRMVRTVAYTIRFRNTFINKSCKGKPLSQEEIEAAEYHLCRQAQFEGFPSEMVILKRNERLPLSKRKFIEKPSQLYDGSPYLDANGVMRMRGRIDGARDLSTDSKRPIILPKDSRITRLLVHHYHAKYFHQNHNTVINEIRQRFYIPRLRVLLKSVRNECQMCKVRLAKVMEPQMADLPKARMATFAKPFSFVGVDYFGPMKVKIGRRNEKRWGVLFTCLTIRAVHIELVSSLTADSCIKAIRNFIADRGEVMEFHSDCGTHFTGAHRELKKEISKMDWDRLETEFTSSYTKWNFNPPASPHMGGSWERLVGSVKSGMYAILPTRKPTDETLRNILKEVQNVVNSRPLTFIPLEVEEDEALTPNHFLHGKSNGMKPPCEIDVSGEYLRKSWKEAQRLTEKFWQRFLKEYLPTITRRTKWHKQVKPICVNDLVLVIDEKNPRNTYPRAKVLETRIGSNGQVRQARVELISEAKVGSNGKIQNVRKTDLWRPAHKLAVLDVLSKPDVSLAEPTKVDRETGGSMLESHVNTGLRRSARIATKKDNTADVLKCQPNSRKSN